MNTSHICLNKNVGLLSKKAYSLAHLQQEWQALQACQSFWVQEAVDVDFTCLEIILRYYPDSHSFLDFTQQKKHEVLHALPYIIRALAFCHSCGFVHGDLKASNILYFPKWQSIKLIDFGAALPIGLDRASLFAWQATPKFASCSTLAGVGQVSAKDDWHALYILLEQVSIQLNERQKAQLGQFLFWLEKKLNSKEKRMEIPLALKSKAPL